MHIRPLYLALLLASLHGAAHAQLFKCKGANDRVVFQDSPCAKQADGPEFKRPVPGQKDPSFAQRKTDTRAGTNWGPRTTEPTLPDVPRQARTFQPPPREPVQAAAVRSPSRGDGRESAQAKAEADNVRAFDKMRQCDYARQQLNVVTEKQPVYSVDNQGRRHYVEDRDRQIAIAVRRERVAEACN